MENKYNQENAIVHDESEWNDWLDGIEEQALIKANEENPEKAKKAIKEWEKEHGRKIGTKN